MPTLADRNNNPGNLRDTKTGSFRQFNSPQEGYAALLNDLQAKKTGTTTTGVGPSSTLADFSKVYAPASDKNNPAQYTANLANHMGVRPDAQLSSLDLGKWADAVSHAEGYSGAPAGIKSAVEKSLTPNTAEAPTGELDKKPEGFLHSLAKGLISPYATFAARPIQAIAEGVFGASPEAIDKFSKEKLGGFVAPVPQNSSDVLKDVGRGAQVVLGGLGAGENVAKTILGTAGKEALTGYGFDIAGGLAGDRGEDRTGAKAFIPGAGTLTGGLLGGGMGTIKKVGGKIAQNAEKSAEELALLKKGSSDTRVVGKKLVEGQIVKDKVAKEAIKQGIPEADVALIKSGSNADKVKMAKMLDIRKNQLTNKRITDRATDVVGDTFIEKVAKPLANQNKKAAQQLDVVAQGLKGNKIDTQGAVSNFVDKLGTSGIKVGKGGKLNFVGSDFEGIKGTENAIKNVWNRVVRVAKSGDAMEAHRAKRYIDEIVGYGKSTEGLSGKAENILKSFRHDIDGVLDTSFPAYNKANTAYAETIGELQKIGDAMGTKFDIGENFANAQAGTKFRQLFSNTQNRANLLQMLESSQSTARKYGAKIGEDIITQANFADVLEKMLGSEASTSLLGTVEKAAGTAQKIASAGKDIVTGHPIKGSLKLAGEVVNLTRGINEENKMNALQELLQKTGKIKGLIKK